VSPAPIRVLVVDDEPPARASLRILLDADPEVAVVGECGDGAAARARLERGDVDLVFLDVQMPLESGLDVARRLGPERMPAVVFTTAHDEHALAAFDVRAVDYLLKPFDDARFATALARAKQALRREAMASRYRELAAAAAELERRTPARPSHEELGARARARRLAVSVAGGTRLLPAEHIRWIEQRNDLARIHVEGEVLEVRETLSALEERLDMEQFFRVHRSALVNVSMVRSIEPRGSGLVRLTLSGGEQVDVARARRRALELRLLED